jgi:hypothetical protein
MYFVQYVIDDEKRRAKLFKNIDRTTLARLAQLEARQGMNRRQLQHDVEVLARKMSQQKIWHPDKHIKQGTAKTAMTIGALRAPLEYCPPGTDPALCP